MGRGAAAIVLVAFVACKPAHRSQGGQVQVGVAVAIPAPPAVPAVPDVDLAHVDLGPVCARVEAPGACENIVDAAEQRALDASIDQAQKQIIATQYQDPYWTVEKSRLQARRDSQETDDDGPHDLARATKNAQRSLAVASDYVPARIALAISYARSLAPTPQADLRAALVERMVRGLSETPGPMKAAQRVLVGYAALERGDPASAKVAFKDAIQSDPQLGSAWAGLGDTLRSAGAFDEAGVAYDQALKILPSDNALKSSREAARRAERLPLPRPTRVGRALGPLLGSLSPLASPRAGATCPPSALVEVETRPFCEALELLAQAQDGRAREDAAYRALEAFNTNLKSACSSKTPTCGRFVIQGLGAVASSFDGNKIAKGIATRRIALGASPFDDERAVLQLELGDAYMSIGVLNEASSFYEQSVKAQGPHAEETLDRVLALKIALGQTAEAGALAGWAAKQRLGPPGMRARRLALAAAALRDAGLTKGYDLFLSEYRGMIDDGRLLGETGELLRPDDAPLGCVALLSCAARRLAGESRWNPGK
jgi:tetratricopeptide (TPR) repeat protein